VFAVYCEHKIIKLAAQSKTISFSRISKSRMRSLRGKKMFLTSSRPVHQSCCRIRCTVVWFRCFTVYYWATFVVTVHGPERDACSQCSSQLIEVSSTNLNLRANIMLFCKQLIFSVINRCRCTRTLAYP